MTAKQAPVTSHGRGGQPKASLAPLDGIRVLCNLAILLSHTVYALGVPPNHHTFHATLRAHPLLVLCVNCALVAMDTFMILSGLLACYHLVPAMQQGPPLQAALTYLRRRLLRIAPPYYAILLFTWLLVLTAKAAGDPYMAQRLILAPPVETSPVDSSPAYVAMSLLFLQNWRFGGFLPLSWNLAVQMQFYVLLPLLLLLLQPRSPGFRGRVVALSLALLAIGLAWRAGCVKVLGIRLPFPLYHQQEKPGFLNSKLFLHYIYMSTAARLPHLAIGVLLGCLALSPSAQDAVRRRWMLATSASAAAAAFLVAIASVVPEAEFTEEAAQAAGPGVAQFAYVWVMGLLHPAAIAVVIAAVLSSAGPVSRVALQVLSHAGWKLPAQLSYTVYLLHALAILVVWQATTALAEYTPVQLFLAPAGGAMSSASSQLLQHLAVLLCLWCAVYGVSAAGAVALESALVSITG